MAGLLDARSRYSLAVTVGSIALLAACGGGSPSSPTPTPTTTAPPPATVTPAPAPTTQVLTDARLTAIVARSSELSFRAINDAVDHAGISIALGARPLAFSDIVLKNRTERQMFACPNGGTATIDISVTGVMGTRADNMQITERQTYLNCAVTFDDGQTVTVSGTLTGVGSYGRTPTGEQSFRRTGSFTYLLEPSNVTARCEADLSINYLNLRDPRARASGSACGRAISILLPSVTPAFPNGVQQTPPAPAAGQMPDSGLYTGSYNYLPSPCGNYDGARWAAIFRNNGTAIDITFTAFFFESEVLTLQVPLNPSRRIQFRVQSALTIDFDATFSADFQTISGTFTTSPCVNGGPGLEGRWTGTRQ